MFVDVDTIVRQRQWQWECNRLEKPTSQKCYFVEQQSSRRFSQNMQRSLYRTSETLKRSNLNRKYGGSELLNMGLSLTRENVGQ